MARPWIVAGLRTGARRSGDMSVVNDWLGSRGRKNACPAALSLEADPTGGHTGRSSDSRARAGCLPAAGGFVIPTFVASRNEQHFLRALQK